MTKNQIEYWKMIEDSRHNKEVERETNRANQAKEQEQQRSNLSNEDIAREKNKLTRQANTINQLYNERYLSETERANLAREAVNKQQADISAANLDLGYSQLDNSYRIAGLNYAVGMANVGATYASIAEQNRANIAKETELNRSNLVNEALKWKSAGTEMYKAQTIRQGQELDYAKWSDPVVRAQRQADYFHTIADTGRLNTQSQLNSSNVSLNESTKKLNSAKTFQSYTQGARNVADLVGTVSKTIINGVAAAATGGK